VDPAQLVARLDAEQVLRIERPELDALLDRAALLRHEDTRLAGDLRILDLDGTILLQEQTPRGELLLRRLASSAEAHALADDRLATYERMWDGCGCKVDYFG